MKEDETKEEADVEEEEEKEVEKGRALVLPQNQLYRYVL